MLALSAKPLAVGGRDTRRYNAVCQTIIGTDGDPQPRGHTGRRGVAIVGACLVLFYARKLLARRRGERSAGGCSVNVSDVRLYGRYQTIADALEGVGIVRESQKTPEQCARGAAHGMDEPGMERLGEIYPYARFRDAGQASLAQEFDVLEPRVLAAIERLEATQTVKG